MPIFGDDSILTRFSLALPLLCLLAVLAATPALSQVAQPSPAPPQPIKLGDKIERNIADERYDFQLDCIENTYFRVTIDQQGIDVSARFVGPDKKPVLVFNGNPSTTGQEIVELVCPANGPVSFSVQAGQRGVSPGKITLSFSESRPATDKDRGIDEGNRLLVSATELWRAAKYSEALPLALRCLEVRERALGPEHPEVGLALFTVGNIYSDLPDLPKAANYYDRAVANRSKALGPDHLSLASIYNNYGIVYKDMARYPEALAMFERALAIREKALNPEHLLVVSVLNNIALVQRLRGEDARAQELYARVLAVREKALGPDNPDVATAINNLANTYWDPERSEPLYLRALAIREAKLSPDHPDIAQTAYNLAVLYASQGQFDKAEAYGKRTLDIFKKSLGAEHPLVTMPMNLLAGVLKNKGDLTGAERLYEETIALKERTEGPFHPNLGGTLTSVADLYSMMGKMEKAAAALERANSIFEYNIRLNLASGSEVEKIKYVDMLSTAGDLALAASFDPKKPNRSFAPIAFASVLARKGRVLDSMSQTLVALRSRLNNEDRDLLDSWNAANEKISKMVIAGPENEPIEAFRKTLSGLDEERDRIERKLSAQGSLLLENATGFDPEAVWRSIPSDAVLIEFVNFRPARRSRFEFLAVEPDEAKTNRPARYAALVVNSSGSVEAFDLGESEAIDRQLGLFRAALRNRSDRNVNSLASAAALRIFEPLRKAIGPAKHILVSPDGNLNLVPFEALADRNGRYLVEDFTFSYLSSGRDLLARRSTVKAAEPLLIADPDFGLGDGRFAQVSAVPRSVTATRNFNDTFFAPLSATEDEVNAIRAMFPSAKVLSKSGARESELKRITSPKFLHIATHGFFVENPVGLIGSGADGTRGAVPSIAKRNPLLRSGLAFAGANSRISGEDDGILTALEVTGLDLRGSRLVVLSACDTGMGEVKTGEGVFGLRRAFKLAGAESLVMSLWPVSDQVTKELMSGYYRNLKQGLGRGESLRSVQLEMLAKPARRHPFYWASFIHAGEWGPLDTGR
jgi:CHAT domain-containing protein/Tfp pilus assembly protein PilF